MKELQLKYGCNPNQKPSRIFMQEGELPIEVINGRPGYINFLDALNAWQLVKELKRLDTIGVEYVNEQDAVKRLMKLETWLAFTTRQFTPKELKSLQAQKYLPRAIPIAYDGLAIIVNNENADTCITVKDFARILRGEATKWGDIYPQSKLGTIDVVFDNPLSSTVRWCVDSILGGKEFTNPNIGAVKTSAAVIDYVERHKNSLGIIGSAASD